MRYAISIPEAARVFGVDAGTIEEWAKSNCLLVVSTPTRNGVAGAGFRIRERPDIAKRILETCIPIMESAELAPDDNVFVFGLAVDTAALSSDAASLARLRSLSVELFKRPLSEQAKPALHYFLSNAIEERRTLLRADDQAPDWAWDDPDVLDMIQHLRLASSAPAFPELNPVLRAQVLTNLANGFDFLGRVVEAIELWDAALAAAPDFPMAVGNRGHGLTFYARAAYEAEHKAFLFRRARKDLKAALSRAGALEPAIADSFRSDVDQIEATVPIGFLECPDPDDELFPLGKEPNEVAYRKWCLVNALFLNPLNDLGSSRIGEGDVLTLPEMVFRVREFPSLPGHFNQMVQEFVSARYLFYEATGTSGLHFSDSHVHLVDNLDYAVYSIAVEKAKAAFRIAYSVMDKVAYFINEYFGLKIRLDRVSFRSVWRDPAMKKDEKFRLRPEFHAKENWSLRGLYWLSKDLFDDGIQPSLPVDQKDIVILRHAMEHRYVKVVEDYARDEPPFRPADKMALRLSRTRLFELGLRMLKLCRAALIYLALAVRSEELERRRSDGSKAVVGRLPYRLVPNEFKH